MVKKFSVKNFDCQFHSDHKKLNKETEEINMVGHRANTKTSAKKQAMRARKKGLEATVFKKKKGYGVSVTRK